MLDPGLAHFINELRAIPRRGRVGPGVLQPGHKPHAFNLDLTVLDHEGQVAHVFLNLGRRRLGSFFPGSGGIRLDLNLDQRQHQHQGTRYPGPPGNGSPHGPPPCVASHSGRTPGPVSRTKTRHQSVSQPGSPAHFPVRQATAGRANPRRPEPSRSTSHGQVRLGIFQGVVASCQCLCPHYHNPSPRLSRSAELLVTGTLALIFRSRELVSMRKSFVQQWLSLLDHWG